MPREEARGIAQAILDLKNNSRYCTVCNNITEDEVCGICRDDKRDATRICVVEEPSNILILEKSGIFRGRYHALMGAISPLDGIGPEDLKIDGLMERLKAGGIKEVIIATNPTVKGETTALYLSKLIKPLGISVSRIAYGLPVGGDIEYADENTVSGRLKAEGKCKLIAECGLRNCGYDEHHSEFSQSTTSELMLGGYYYGRND